MTQRKRNVKIEVNQTRDDGGFYYFWQTINKVNGRWYSGAVKSIDDAKKDAAIKIFGENADVSQIHVVDNPRNYVAVMQKQKQLTRKKNPVTPLKSKTRKAPIKRNPSAPSTIRRQINQAVKLYEAFTGHLAQKFLKNATVHVPEVGVLIGRVDGIMYTTVRDGKTEKYLHEFTGVSCPTLCCSADGKHLFFVGGKYLFTDRGITDKK